MASPKKKTSKTKKNSRRSNWNKKVEKRVAYALSLGKSLLKDNPKSFILS